MRTKRKGNPVFGRGTSGYLLGSWEGPIVEAHCHREKRGKKHVHCETGYSPSWVILHSTCTFLNMRYHWVGNHAPWQGENPIPRNIQATPSANSSPSSPIILNHRNQEFSHSGHSPSISQKQIASAPHKMWDNVSHPQGMPISSAPDPVAKAAMAVPGL